MRCFLLTLGTHGDVELFRLLGRELARRGHEVTVGASPFYRERIERTRLEFLPIGRGSQGDLLALFRSLATEPNQRARVRAYAERWVRPQLAHSLPEVKAQLAHTDYFINNLRSVWREGTRVIPGAAVTYDPVGNAENLRKYAAQLAGYERAVLEIVAMPKALVDPDDAWGERFHFTGFWRDPEPSPWRPPDELLEFVAAGAPPVAITMGSMLSFDPVAFVSTIRDALAIADERGVLVAAWSSDLVAAGASDRLYVVGEAPYDSLFPRCRLVVHHGGAGTVAAALRAGRPSILLPQIASQGYFAAILHRAGVLVDEFDVRTWTPELLAAALVRGRDEESFTRAAENWLPALADEDGLARAVSLMEAHYREM